MAAKNIQDPASGAPSAASALLIDQRPALHVALPALTAALAPAPVPGAPPADAAGPATLVPAPVGPPDPDLVQRVAGPLNGLATPRGLALRRPLAIMVENYAPDARPQTGLLAASVVFETVAEYGITRFMAVYQEQDAAVVGPVRSARVYYDHWAEGLQAIFVHAGGNSDAVRELWVLPNLVNVDEVATERGLNETGAAYFFRSSARLAPHNLYTYPDRVRVHVQGLNSWASGEPPWRLAHKADAPLKQRGITSTIDITFSGPAYAVHYDYDRPSNSYLRSMAGQPHRDALTNVRIAPKNVALLLASVTPDTSSDTPGSIVVTSEGQGLAYYFSDGLVRRGSWRKDSVDAQLLFFDSKGQKIFFNPGQTWVEVAPEGDAARWTGQEVK